MPRTLRNVLIHTGLIDEAARRTSTLARANDLSTPAARLGRWKVRDVVAHLGGVHRWAERIVANRSMAGPGFTKSKLDGSALCDWFDEGAAALTATLSSVVLDEACPNFSPGSSKTVGWWLRRQVHETTVHRWDVERALGEVTPIDRDVAADGIDEYLDTFVRPRGKHTLSAPLGLTTTDPDRSWTLRPANAPGRVEMLAGPAGTPTARLTGAPDDVLLVLWNRLTVDEAALTVAGDLSVIHSFRA